MKTLLRDRQSAAVLVRSVCVQPDVRASVFMREFSVSLTD